jgi:hypothetical protein
MMMQITRQQEGIMTRGTAILAGIIVSIFAGAVGLSYGLEYAAREPMLLGVSTMPDDRDAAGTAAMAAALVRDRKLLKAADLPAVDLSGEYVRRWAWNSDVAAAIGPYLIVSEPSRLRILVASERDWMGRYDFGYAGDVHVLEILSVPTGYPLHSDRLDLSRARWVQSGPWQDEMPSVLKAYSLRLEAFRTVNNAVIANKAEKLLELPK